MKNIRFKLDEKDFEKLVSGEDIIKEITVQTSNFSIPFRPKHEVIKVRFFLSDIGYDRIVNIVGKKYHELLVKELRKKDE